MFKTQYTRFLESEVTRLQGENRRLLNVILPHQGFDPLDEKEAKPQPEAKRKNSWRSIGHAQVKKTLENIRTLVVPGVEDSVDQSKSA